tara:strand:- start:420 stop:1184 length:765 start_codon:yes stop_codon:yes gene_type:complete
MARTYYGPFNEQYNDYATPSSGNAGRFPAGSKLVLPDERGYRFTENDGTAEVAATLYQSALPIAHATETVVNVATAAGATSLSSTHGGSTVAVDLYAEGTVHTNKTTGLGYAFRIKRAVAAADGHAAVSSGAVITVNLETPETLQVALTTSSELTYTQNRFRNVLIHDSPPTGALVGISPGVAAADRWYWSQTEGDAPVVTEGTLVIGDFCVPTATTPGAVMPSNAFETDGPYVGVVRHVNITAEISLVDLKID